MWRCNANATRVPATLTRFAQRLFRLLCNVLKALPDVEPTRGTITR